MNHLSKLSRPRAKTAPRAFCRALLLAAALGLSGNIGFAQDKPEFKALDSKIQDVKKDVLDLNRDLFVLEEELLFPANTQVAVFLSVDVGKLFVLESVQVKLDDKVIANYLYTERESDALKRGGVHRVYTGNLRAGKHELIALFTGKGPHERDYRRGTTLVFEKTVEPKFIELQIKDRQQRLQPEFEVKEWQ